jgi:polyphosphate kinase
MLDETPGSAEELSEARIPAPVDLDDPALYFNRELSWLDFNERVLEEAADPSVPLLERLRFLAITSSNLDEFFEVRVAGLLSQIYDKLEPQDPPADGMSALAQLDEISKRVRAFVDHQYEIWREEICPQLAEHGIVLPRAEDLTEEEIAHLDRFFESEVYPVLTPLAIDPAHPFPHLHNKSLNLILRLERADAVAPRQLYAVLQVPSVLGRLVPLPSGPTTGSARRFVLLEDVIGPRLDSLFGGFRVVAHASFRVTRNSDLSIQENEVKTSLLSTIQENLRRRMWGAAVRLEISDKADDAFVTLLQTAQSLDLEDRDIYRIPGPVALSPLTALCKLPGYRDLKDAPFEPQMPQPLGRRGPIFDAIREQDVLVHHPFESFEAVTRLIEQAADDPHVLAIKMTLYRTAEDNPIIDALARAAGNGKQVTVLVEIQARLDEENNISKARMLQKAGVHVVYGMVGLKTHCKATLIVRKEHDGIRRYMHLGTGNYNSTTARLYTDLGLLTCRPDLGEDASAVFNLLTGYSQGHDWQKLIVAPLHLADRIVAMIDREREHAKQGRPARIIVKMNSLVDPRAIRALYRASQAGTRIDLIVRGICCLRPGVPGVSENIRVISIIDKFLEHSRISYFQNGEQPEIYLSSADWMPRNFNRRVELMFPIEDPRLHERILHGILGVYLADNVKARRLNGDGTYTRVPAPPGVPKVRSQIELEKMARIVQDGNPLRAGGKVPRSELSSG